MALSIWRKPASATARQEGLFLISESWQPVASISPVTPMPIIVAALLKSLTAMGCRARCKISRCPPSLLISILALTCSFIGSSHEGQGVIQLISSSLRPDQSEQYVCDVPINIWGFVSISRRLTGYEKSISSDSHLGYSRGHSQ